MSGWVRECDRAAEEREAATVQRVPCETAILRTTVTIEYAVSESIADTRCNYLTDWEKAEWVAEYIRSRTCRLVNVQTTKERTVR